VSIAFATYWQTVINLSPICAILTNRNKGLPKRAIRKTCGISCEKETSGKTINMIFPETGFQREKNRESLRKGGVIMRY
jgi:hypothetical protein